MKIIIATIKSWNIENAKQLQKKYKRKIDITIISEKEQLDYNILKEINPDYIFFPHWSWIIHSAIFDNYKCVVFHMTDLPFGRGGSPLQNLITRGIENTKISAVKVGKGIDRGEIYIKEDLNLNGSADEILIRTSKTIFQNMIPYILENDIVPRVQQGEISEFKRRKPEESELQVGFNLNQLYDQIRMLDGEGYPKAFLKFGKYKLLFSRASFKGDKIIADVEIMEDENE